LNFTVNQPISWIGYCLDEQANVTVFENFTLTELASGPHTLTLYLNYTVGNMGASETIIFLISKPFPTTIAVISIVTITVVVIGIIVYFKKYRK